MKEVILVDDASTKPHLKLDLEVEVAKVHPLKVCVLD